MMFMLNNSHKIYCHMVYYTKVLEANFDAFEKFRQIDGKLRALTLGGALKFKK